MRLKSSLCVLTAASLAAAQIPAEPPARLAGPGALNILVVQGKGSQHHVVTKAATQTVVEVRNENQEPVPGVPVVFELPESGPGGSFPGGRTSQRATTDLRGQAATVGFVPNDRQGAFTLRVTAGAGDRLAVALVNQVNSTSSAEPKLAKRSNKGRWLLVGLAAAGAAVAIALASGKSGDTPTAAPPEPSIVLVPGPVSVGGPR